MESITYREMRDGEEGAVVDLVRQVFDEFVAPDYGAEGIEEFFKFANPSALRARVKQGGFVVVAEGSTGLVGMLEFMPPCFIALLFVTLRREGIASSLFKECIKKLEATDVLIPKLTVHSSPYAVPIYKKLGFHRTGEQTTENGITYIPMECGLRALASSG